MASLSAKAKKVVSKIKSAELAAWFRTDRRAAVLVIIVVVVVGVTATFIARAAQVVDEETVRLSNGKEIRLGQSVQSLERTLTGQLYKINNQQYSYPGKSRQPIEAVFDTENNQVVVIHLVSGEKNVARANDARVGLNLKITAAKDKRAQAVRGTMAHLRQKGIQINQARSTQYLLPDVCENNDQIGLVSLVLKNYEHRLVKDMGGADCPDPHNH